MLTIDAARQPANWFEHDFCLGLQRRRRRRRVAHKRAFRREPSTSHFRRMSELARSEHKKEEKEEEEEVEVEQR